MKKHTPSLLSAVLWQSTILFIIILPTFQLAAEISINCGSPKASVSPDGKRWLGETHSNLTIIGSSTTQPASLVASNPVPYTVARISRSRFSYIFQVNPGQKLIRFHFNPTLYYGFESSKDLFTVEAGRFTLLSNFSASIAANALSLSFVTREFCLIVGENLPLTLTFSPETASTCCRSQDTHAFVNGIEIISVPETTFYCKFGDSGVPVVGEKFPLYIDNSSTVLEVIHRHNVKRDSVSYRDGMFGTWGEVFQEMRNSGNGSRATWRISVDVGFGYLVRLHFCELGLKLAENGNNSFSVLVDNVVVYTNIETERVEQGRNRNDLLYRNYMVMAKGPKLEGKRDILISLLPKGEFKYGHGPLEGFEIFKISNHDYSLSSPNPLLPEPGFSSWVSHDLLAVFGSRNKVATAVIIIISLVNVIVHMVRQIKETYFPEEEKKPSTRVTRICRCFSLPEIHAATKNFDPSFVIGKGGFGKVYKGFINCGLEIVAIKRLKINSKQGKREFWTEVETLSELRHVNLVSLIGYCNEQREMILVYDFMPNGTLSDHLYKLARKNSNHSSLSWEERLNICIGAGRGLDYLHTGKGVIHRDVKSSNILLDETFVAKVSDFGLAKTENMIGLQYQDTTNLKGTFGYIDPDYYRTRKITTKSDIYAFGVVLLEVLCGRPAVDPLAGEDERSLTMWARDNINRKEFDRILAPSLSGTIAPDSLKVFLEIVQSCLHDEPSKRPPIVLGVISLEFALELQKNSLAPILNGIASFGNLLPFASKTQQENANCLGMTDAAGVVPCDNGTQLENAISLSPNEITAADIFPRAERISMPTMQLNVASSDEPIMKSPEGNIDGRKTLIHKLSQFLSWEKRPKSSQRMEFTSISAPITKYISKMIPRMKDQTRSGVLSAESPREKRYGEKSIAYKLSQLLKWKPAQKKTKSSRMDISGISLSAPMTKYVSNETALRCSSSYIEKKLSSEDGSGDLVSTLSLRIYTFSELSIATRNFRADLMIGAGGFGRVYKGFLKEKSAKDSNCASIIAVKRLNPESIQGFIEWQTEVTFLEKLSHPNIVKLLGHCSNDKELLLVYEFMLKGSLERYLFRKDHADQPLSWNLRLNILIGAARGLAYLHNVGRHLIYRDFKASNILLDGSYNAKLSDFGLAKLGPPDGSSHVTTLVMGTCGYAAPEYIATGHLYVKSDVYGFGVVLLEMLTGLRVLDFSRPSGQRSLIELIKPCFKIKKKLIGFMDSRLEGNYPAKSALQVYQLAKNCLENEPKNRPSMREVVEELEAVP